jgi:hypothetical protein
VMPCVQNDDDDDDLLRPVLHLKGTNTVIT